MDRRSEPLQVTCAATATQTNQTAMFLTYGRWHSMFHPPNQPQWQMYQWINLFMLSSHPLNI